jgi:hypothetical protein
MLKYLIRFEPLLSTSAVQTILALVVALGWKPSPGVTGAILAVAAAVLALIAAAQADTVTPALWTGLVTAALTLVVAFGVPHITTGFVSAFSAVLAIVLGAVMRGQTTTKAAAARARTKTA